MIRLGIIGCGAMGEYHAKKFSALDGVALAACFDRDPVRSARFAARWNIPGPYSDLASFFEAHACDAVSCALVDSGHAEAALLAGKHRLPLFLEKPMAMNPLQSASLLDLYRDSRLPLGVNFSKRNFAAVCEARRLVRTGAVGRVTGASFGYLQSWLVDASWGVWTEEERWRWRTTESAGCLGVLGDLGSHLLDLARFILPGVSLVFETARGSRTPRTADVGGAWEEVTASGFADQAGARFPVRLEMSRKAAGHLDHLFCTVTGESGTIELDLDRNRDGVLVAAASGIGAVERRGQPVAGSYADFISLVRCGEADRERLSARGEDGHAVQVLLDEVNRLLEAHS